MTVRQEKIAMELQELVNLKAAMRRPKVICLCGSTRFHKTFEQVNLQETLAGNIVLSIGANAKDEDLQISEEMKLRLDVLHLYKIDICDEVLVINRGGYIGESTRREIEYAHLIGKPVHYLLSLSIAKSITKES